MKHILGIVILLSACFILHAQYSGGGEAYPELGTNKEALEDFQNMRFGMFIHWGPVSLRGEEISWSRGREIPKDEYDQLYKEFNPTKYSAREWVKTAKAAGMRYLVITSRHHDGFSLWDSKYSEYDMAATPYGKGVLKELANECREQGIKFGTYYSICDWYHPDYPVEYPSPDYGFREEKEMDKATLERMNRYTSFMKNQLNELIETVDPFVIWFDGEWEWAWTHEMGMDMYAYLRGLKEDILINNRVDKGREGMEDKSRSARFAGDFGTPEQNVGDFDQNFTWESCMTIGNQWAWKPGDEIKSKKECVHTLISTLGGDGNLLFNVGPMPDGRIEPRQVERLKEMGQWVSAHQEAIYGTRGGPFLPSKKLASTYKGKRIYLYLLEPTGKKLDLPLPDDFKILKVSFLENGQSVKFKQDPEGARIFLPDLLPDETASVLVLDLNRPASDIEPTKL